MRFGRVFWTFFCFSALMALLHIVALEFFLYWTYLWFDIPMHFLGGMIVALGVLTFSIHVPHVGVRFLGRFLPMLTVVVVVGIAWEVYEILIDVPMIDTFDTGLDLVMDIVGGVSGYLLGRHLSPHP